MNKVLYSVKEIEEMTNVSRKTLYYYDHCNLLHPTKRIGTQQWKYYDQDAIQKLLRIRKCREMGFHIEEIKEFNQADIEEQKRILKMVLKRNKKDIRKYEESIKMIDILLKDLS